MPETEGQMEEVKGVVEEPKREIFTRDDMKAVKVQSVLIPLWNGKYAWAHEPTVKQKAGWTMTAARTDGRMDIGRFQLEAFVDIIKDGPGADAQPIFDRLKDWGWLEKQSAAVIENAVQAAHALGIPNEQALDTMRDFFGETLKELKSES